jgi:hypothetical protein
MERMLALIADDPTAAVAGLAGMLCLTAWPLFRRRSTMLAIYIGNNLAFAAHYGILHEWTAVAMNGLMGAQSVVAISLERRPWLRWAYYAFMPMVGGASLVTWHGLPSVFAAAATAFSTLGRLQRNEVLLRTLMLASTPCWTAHDLLVGSLPGLAADLLSMTIGATMLLRRTPAIGMAVAMLRQSFASPVRRLGGNAPRALERANGV